MNKQTILVTGGTGYIAGWIIKYLLEEGHTVHTTVRKPTDTKKTAHLTQIAEKTSGELKIFKADLLEKGSFDEAINQCDIVMHTASPFIISGFKDANEALLRPALEGTRNVLEAVNKQQSVRKVVLTSSVAAIYGDSADAQKVANKTFTEDHWNHSSSAKHQPYSYSKLIAEQEAWKINTEQNHWELIVINPAMVFGPSLTNSSSSSSLSLIKQLGDGSMKSGIPNFTVGVVDVRDVAQAHIKACFVEGASGRHIISATECSFLQLAQILDKHFEGKYPFPKKELPKWLVWLFGPLSGYSRKFVSQNIGHKLAFDNSKSIKSLTMNYRPIETTITEHFQQLIDDKII